MCFNKSFHVMVLVFFTLCLSGIMRNSFLLDFVRCSWFSRKERLRMSCGILESSKQSVASPINNDNAALPEYGAIDINAP